MCLSQDKGEGDGDGTNNEALARFKMVDARLRRLCEKKPSGKVNVPDSVHKQWAAGGKERDELRKMFELYECDKDSNLHNKFHEWYRNWFFKRRALKLFPDFPNIISWVFASIPHAGEICQQSCQHDRGPERECPGNPLWVVHP